MQSLAKLNEYLSNTFDEDKQITFSQLLNYCKGDKCITSFLKLFNVPEIDKKSMGYIDLFVEPPATRLLDTNIAQSRQCISKHLPLTS
jgi:hypothetical protein